jgi:hypothetical protein
MPKPKRTFHLTSLFFFDFDFWCAVFLLVFGDRKSRQRMERDVIKGMASSLAMREVPSFEIDDEPESSLLLVLAIGILLIISLLEILLYHLP